MTIEEKLILSKAYLKNHQYDKAFQLLQNLNQNDALGLYFKTRIELYLGELYFDKSETDKALNHYKIALILAKKLNHP